MNSRVNLKLAGDLLDRCFRQAQGQADRGVELLFLLTELDSTYEKAEPTLEFLATRGLIRSYTSDSMRLTPRGVEVVVQEIDLRTLPEAAPAASAAPAVASIPPAQAAPPGATPPTPTGRPRPPRPFRPTVSYEHEGETVAIELGWVAVMGRSQEADITLPDPRASKKHVEIRYAGDRYLVKDLGSANGTLLNGSYVDQQTLTHGDVLLVGRTEVTYACPEVMIEPRGEAPGDYEPPPMPRAEPRPSPVAEPVPVATARRKDAQAQPIGNELSTERPTARPSRTPPVEEPAMRPLPVPRPLRELSVRVPEPAPTPVRIVKGEPTHRVPELSASEFFAATPRPSAEELFGGPGRPGRPDFGDADTAERPKLPPFTRSAPAEARGSGPGIDLFASGPQASSLVAAATPPAADLFDAPGEATGGTDDLFATTIVRPARGAVSPLPTPVAPRAAEDLLPPAEDLLHTDASFAATVSWPGADPEPATQHEFERPPIPAGVRSGGSAADPEQTLIGMQAVIPPPSRPFSDDEPPIPLPPDFFADVSVVDLGEPRFEEPEPPIADLSPSMEIPPDLDIRQVSLVDTQSNELEAGPAVQPGAAFGRDDDLGDTLVPFVPAEPFAAPPHAAEPAFEAREPVDVPPEDPVAPDPFIERTPVDTGEQRPSGSGALLAALESLPEAEAEFADDGQISQELVSYVDFVRTLDVLGERLRDAGIPDAPEVLEAILRLRRHPAVRAALT